MIMRHDDSPCRSLLQRGGESVTAWLVFGEMAQSMTDVSNIPLNGVDAPNAPFDAARDVSDIRPDDVGALQALLDAARADQGRGGWLDLPRGGLAPPVLCQLTWRTSR